MDGQRFDDPTRPLVSERSRRAMFKVLGEGVAA